MTDAFDFWRSGSGELPVGTPEAAFLRDFSVIPNNTMAIAKIANFNNVTKENKHTGEVDKYFHINWKIIDGEFKTREVSQKIKCFNGTPEAIDRNLNMLKLVMTLCQFSPSHSGAPTDDDLKKMIGKTCGIKIREYSIPKDDGSKPIEGNFVAEVWSSHGFECQTGVKLETSPKNLPYVSAMSRNPRNVNNDLLDDDISF
jgi:hypothetical protein